MSDRDLIIRSAELAQAAPSEWAAFLAAFQKYSESRRDLCVQASLENLQNLQGKAQQCVALAGLFGNAVQTAAKIAGKQK